MDFSINARVLVRQTLGNLVGAATNIAEIGNARGVDMVFLFGVPIQYFPPCSGISLRNSDMKNAFKMVN
jgi:hypothetical protein